jgi:hypothetical protein
MLCGVARSHGSLISLQELLPLLPEHTSASEFADAISSNPSLRSRFQLKDGYVIENFGETGIDLDFSENLRGRLMARKNMKFASRFVSLLHSNPFRIIAVSGSTSYGSASRSRDIDLFCIAPAGRMWVSLVQGLLLARVFGLLNRKVPQICFSCIMDEGYAEAAFTTPQGPLFARDALEARVQRGRISYRSLLRQSGWMASFYPAAYSAITGRAGEEMDVRRKPSRIAIVQNMFLSFTVGTFIKMKSSLLNRKLLSSGQEDSLFAVRCAHDHLFHESNRYLALRRKYSDTW